MRPWSWVTVGFVDLRLDDCAVRAQLVNIKSSLVAAWQSTTISQDTLLHNLRTGEILPSASCRAAPMSMTTMPMNAHKHELNNQNSGLLQK